MGYRGMTVSFNASLVVTVEWIDDIIVIFQSQYSTLEQILLPLATCYGESWTKELIVKKLYKTHIYHFGF